MKYKIHILNLLKMTLEEEGKKEGEEGGDGDVVRLAVKGGVRSEGLGGFLDEGDVDTLREDSTGGHGYSGGLGVDVAAFVSYSDVLVGIAVAFSGRHFVSDGSALVHAGGEDHTDHSDSEDNSSDELV
jgi:hypothetical protein